MTLLLDPPAPVEEERPARTRGWLLAVALVLLQVPVVLDLDLPVLRVVAALVTLLAFPTLVLFRRADLPGDTGPARFLHAFGASLLGLMAGGLVVNTVGPLVGVERPLQPAVLGVTWLVLDLALLAWRRSVPLGLTWAPRRTVRALLGVRWEAAQACAALAVVLAVLGAVRLNNGGDGVLAVTAHLLAAAAVLALLVRSGDLGRDVRVVGLVATALLLATSLRGWQITGHDIQAEYFVFRLADGNQHWAMELFQNAYNACLSVTVLPVVLAQTTGLSGVVVLKVALQLVFALVPVATYLLSRRFLPRRLALTATVFALAFPTFFTDMPYLVRQEIAFFFLALLVLAATEPDRSARFRRGWVMLLGAGVVLSHYSTTYLLILALVIGLLTLAAGRLAGRVARRPRAERTPLVLLSPVVVVTLTVLAALWTGPATHTGGHAADVARDTVAALLGERTGPRSSDVDYWLFSGDRVTPRERLDLFVDETLELREQAPQQILLLTDLGPDELTPEIVSASKVPPTAAGEALEEAGVDPAHVDTALRLGTAGLLQVLLLTGVAGLVVAVARRPDPSTRPPARSQGLAQLTGELAAVVLGVMAALGLVVLVPPLSVEYGVLRAFQQSLLVVAPVMAAGLWLLARVFRSRAALVSLAVPVGALLVLTGVASTAVGGHPGRLALQSSGLYYERYVAPDADVQAMRWLAEAEDTSGDQPKVIAGRSYTLRVAAAGDRPVDVVDRLYPTLLTKGSYVFADSTLVRTGRATVFSSGDRITYRYPTHVLDRHLDLVYSAGRSRVYR